MIHDLMMCSFPHPALQRTRTDCDSVRVHHDAHCLLDRAPIVGRFAHAHCHLGVWHRKCQLTHDKTEMTITLLRPCKIGFEIHENVFQVNMIRVKEWLPSAHQIRDALPHVVRRRIWRCVQCLEIPNGVFREQNLTDDLVCTQITQLLLVHGARVAK
jgi:hypothetical protein